MKISEGWVVLLCLGCLAFGMVIGDIVSHNAMYSDCSNYGKYAIHGSQYDVTATCEVKNL